MNPVRWGLDHETQDGKSVLMCLAGPAGECFLMKRPRSFGAIWEAIYSLAGKVIAFNADYDIRAWLKFLPRRVWVELYRDEFAKWRDYKISYQASRILTVTKGSRTVSVFDAFQHFQSSLRKALHSTFGKSRDKGTIPEGWYERMREIVDCPRRFPRLAWYTALDGMGVRDLWANLDDQFRKLGVDTKRLDRPISPGSIAAGYFGPRLRFENLPPWANRLARRAYAGGRIEVFRRGSFRGVSVLDIKSAYPAELAKLPDPRNLTAIEDARERSDAQYSVYGCVVDIPPGELIPPVPAWHPEKGIRIFPAGTFWTWITGPEYKWLQARGWIKKLVRGVHLVGERRTWIGPDIKKLFKLRKSRPDIQHAIKLVLNSVYGKLAQVENRKRPTTTIRPGSTRWIGGKPIESQETFGSTTNFFVAAYITAMVRLKMLEAMNVIGTGRIVLAATDGLAFTGRIPPALLRKSGTLGSWTVSCRGARIVVVGTGVYSIKVGRGAWQNRVRGWRGLDDLVSALRSKKTRVAIRQRIAYTLADAVTKSKADLNVIADVSRELNVNFDHKRAWPRPWKRAREVLARAQDSKPLILMEGSKYGRKQSESGGQSAGAGAPRGDAGGIR